MGSGIYVAMAGAVAQSNALDVTANNISNAGTTAFRADRLRFSQALSRAKGKDTVYVASTGGATDKSPGAITETGNPLDVALQGDGYIGVQPANGTRYTRAGNLSLDGSGQLVTADGNTVRGVDGKPLKVTSGSGDAAIHSDGALYAGDTKVGQIELVQLDPSSITREGSSLYATAKPTLANATPPTLVAGSLEQGNFNVVRGVVDLVRISRTYEALHQMLESYKHMDATIAKGAG